MRLVVQRVLEATVRVDDIIVGQIKRGLVIFFGAGDEDDGTEIPWLANKVINMRIFNDTDGKFNHNLQEVGGEILLISQFTLYANCTRGKRPDFTHACPPGKAREYYQAMIEELSRLGYPPQTGTFAAHMIVSYVNEGPVTIILDRNSAETREE